MIDVSQWRASIGLWNYCQAASSRPANGCHSHSFKAAVDSKSGSTTSGEKTSKLPAAALSLIVFLLLVFHTLSLLRHILMIPPTGICYQVQCTTGVTVTDTNYLQSVVLPVGSSSNLIYNDLYLIVCLRMLLLLSGDIELNPGPMIDDQPSCFLFVKYLEPLVDWEPFALCLPGGITQLDVDIIKRNGCSYLRMEALHKRWLQVNPTASWRDVINALKQCKENELVDNIELQMKWSTGGTDDNMETTISNDDTTCTSTETNGISSNDNVASNANPDTIKGNPKDILRTHSVKLTDAITTNLYRVTDALYAEGLISLDAKENVQTVPGISDYRKSSQLVSVIQRQLESSLNPEQYFIDICHVLINQQHCTLTDIATSILHQLGQSVPDNVSSHTVPPSPVEDVSNIQVTNIRGLSNVAKAASIPDDVQGYADNMRQHYKHQPIVATDWPPRIGKDFFGRLALVEKQDSSVQTESAWHMLRGQVDKTVKLTENEEISVEDVLRPTDISLSLRVVIDGPPGIGKTTLCRKLLNMWSNGTLPHQQYDLVLYCPLRNSKIATATTLADLFVHQRYEVPMVAEWFEKRNGEGLLIIFDGWDELSAQLRQSSFAASIIHRKQLDLCSVIVTSRSYASSSLLEIDDPPSRHVQVIGFSEKEILIVIIKTLQKDTKLAQKIMKYIGFMDESDIQSDIDEAQLPADKDSQLAVKLINDLEVRDDVQSLCYIPLVCSMVILVYRKEGGHLPTTLTQLYENFILQTIRRHVKRHDINPRTLSSLSSLPSQFAKPLQEMCQLAYTNLANTTMTFSSHEVQSLSEAVKEDYLGLMTTFMEYDEEKYQFLHLSIQEFLSAWWIAKHEEKTEEVFKDHFDDDHFRMCLRFVAGLTHLEHENYQQYFNIQQLHLQCKRKPLFGFEKYHRFYFHKIPEIRFLDHVKSHDFDNVPILLQLLYESRNTKLCHALAQSINDHSLCLFRVSLFDWLCLTYCINNSNTTWNHIHLRLVSNQEMSVFISGLTNNSSLQTQCKRLEVGLKQPTDELMHRLLQSSLLYNIQECYCDLYPGQYVPCLVLLEFLNLPQLKILHVMMDSPTIPTDDNYTDKCTELEKCIAINSTLQEIKIEYSGMEEITCIIINIIRGITRNKTITSLTLDIDHDDNPPSPLPDGIIEQLLKDNNTLQALSLVIPDDLLSSSLNIVEVNTPLNALEIGQKLGVYIEPINPRLISLLQHIKGLHCLVLHEQYPLSILFLSHPCLHALTLLLDTAENATELFTILQTNTTLKALSVEIWEERVYTNSSMGTSLQDMLMQNQTLNYFKLLINDILNNMTIPSSFLSSLTTGLRRNTSLKQLSVSIPLNEEIRTFINVISQKNNLTELELIFKLDQSYSNRSREEKEQIMTPLFYEQVLPAVTNMLQSHTAIRLLRIECVSISKLYIAPIWKQLVQHIYETIFIHPSLEYFEIEYTSLLEETLKHQKESFIDIHRREQPNKPLPVVKFTIIHD
uniref:NACHT domain-containing protein n=1 Tax=Amphimedon queenslandica TaxID=400682 RepID=A0A1X7TGA2_AMPQE